MKKKHFVCTVVFVMIIAIAVFVVWRIRAAQTDPQNAIHFKIQPLSPGFSDDY